MALKNYRIHKNFIEQELDGNIKILDATMFDPELETIAQEQDENREVQEMASFLPDGLTPDVAKEVPFADGDSRKLLENQVITKLEIEEQSDIRAEILVSLTEAFNEASKDKMDAYDNKRQQIYNLGAREAIQFASSQLNFKNICLYGMEEYYRDKSSRFINILNDEADTEDIGYPRSRHQGTASAYLNIANLIQNKLALAEAIKFKVLEDTNVR